LCLSAEFMDGDPFFLLDQLLQHFNTPLEGQSSELRMVVSITRAKLEAIWPQTMAHLRELEKENKHGGKHGAKVVIDLWNTLGKRAGLSELTNPLLGCSWYRCPLYAEKTEKKMARCVRCWKAQYCSKTCQRG
jgi:hypothetical protein